MKMMVIEHGSLSFSIFHNLIFPLSIYKTKTSQRVRYDSVFDLRGSEVESFPSRRNMQRDERGAREKDFAQLG